MPYDANMGRYSGSDNACNVSVLILTTKAPGPQETRYNVVLLMQTRYSISMVSPPVQGGDQDLGNSFNCT
jgi:hypothetical protein